MSLARAALLARPRTATCLCRPLSSDIHSHREGHHDEHHDSTEYPREGFGGPIWRNTVLFSLLVVGFYKYAPAPSDDVYLTRWIAMYSASPDLWLNINAKHTAQQKDISEMNVLLSDAKKARVHRYRYPQGLDSASPFLNAVGMDVDMSSIVVKGDKDF